MTFTINNTDYNPTFDEAYFEVNSIINNKSNDNNVESKDNEKNNKNTNSNANQTCDPKIDTNCKIENNNESSTNNTNNTDNNSNNMATSQNNKDNVYVVKPTVSKITMTMNGEKTEKVDSEKTEKTTKTATLEDVIYPLYLPTGTVLKDQEKVSKTDGERVILTFVGDKGFTLVEETATKEKEFTIIPTYGEPGFVNDTIGAITDNSLNWISNGVEYYMVSDVMNTIELLDVANSINVTAVANLK